MVPFSIITPSFNQGRFLEATIDSVLAASVARIEYIVVDGGSTDASAEILKRRTNELTRWVSESDRGQANALNKGLSWATGEIVGWINSDDLLCVGALDKVLNFFVSHPDAVWCTGSCELIAEDGLSRAFLDADPAGTLTEWLLHWKYRRAAVIQPSTFWRRWAGAAVGPLREDLHYAFDFDFFYRMRKRFGPPAQLDVVLSKFRLHEASKTVAAQDMFFLEILDIVRQEVRSLPEVEQKQVLDWLRSERTHECFIRQQLAASAGRRLEHWQWRARGWLHRLRGPVRAA